MVDEVMMDIRNWAPEDNPAINDLLDRAFGPARYRRTAALLRGDSAPVFAAVAEAAGQIIGSVAIHPVRLIRADGAELPLMLLGPLVSHPDRRGEGIGLRLMAAATDWLDRERTPSALIGDAPYYERFGYRARNTAGWHLPGPVDRARLLLRAPDPALFDGPAWLVAGESAALAA
jgi:predicted N-acetyltransferase YhbS